MPVHVARVEEVVMELVLLAGLILEKPSPNGARTAGEQGGWQSPRAEEWLAEGASLLVALVTRVRAPHGGAGTEVSSKASRSHIFRPTASLRRNPATTSATAFM